MRKTAIFVVCVLILCGGLCHFYLAAQVKVAESEAQNNARSVLSPEYAIVKPITECCPAVPGGVPIGGMISVNESIQMLPSDRTFEVHHSLPTSDGHFVSSTPLQPQVQGPIIFHSPVAPLPPTPILSPVSTFPSVSVAVSPVVPEKAGPDIGKFRLPIEYTLHNIPVESLIDFLTEVFPQVEAEEAEETGKISITASLTDHRTITKMLTDLKREIESISNEAAGNGAEVAEQTIVVFPIRYESARNFLTQHRSTLNPLNLLRIAVDDCTHSLVVAGTAKQLAVVEELVHELDQPAPETIFYDFGIHHFGIHRRTIGW